jgi:hypothetical protein
MSDMTETNPTDPLYYSPSCIPRIIKSHVEELFKKNAPFRRGELRRNPVHAGWFVHGEDPIAPQKRVARRALLAREWFYEFGPRDAPPLPVSGYEIEDMRFAHKFGSRAGFYHLIAHFARSLWCNDWDFNIHPTFEDFASSMLASDFATPDFVKNDEELCKRYPPRALCTIVPGGIWKPPEVNKNNRRIIARRK